MTIDSRIIVLIPDSMHVRHGKRWNFFQKELIPKIQSKSVRFVDIIEAINLFLNIYFGFLVRDTKSIDSELKEIDITHLI